LGLVACTVDDPDIFACLQRLFVFHDAVVRDTDPDKLVRRIVSFGSIGWVVMILVSS
jgi:hypothetical protein